MSAGLSKKVMKFVLALHSIARWMKIIPLPATYTDVVFRYECTK